MHTKVKRENSHLLRRASRKFTHSDENITHKDNQPVNAVDSFQLRIAPDKLSADRFLKITKAMRKELDASPNSESGALLLGQTFSHQEITKIANLSDEELEYAYLEGVYVNERYCALVDPTESSIRSNANRFMADYLRYMHHPKSNSEKIEWVKKDYKAGTGGENVEADAELVKRARQFRRRVHHIDIRDNNDHLKKQTKAILEKDDNGLTAFIALRRARFATH